MSALTHTLSSEFTMDYIEDSCSFEDMQLWPSVSVAPPPPPLPPIDASPCFPDQCAKQSCVQSMSTPVMHPKLVDTLKYIISPSPTSWDQFGSFTGAGGFGLSPTSSDQSGVFSGGAGFGSEASSDEERISSILREWGGKRRPEVQTYHSSEFPAIEDDFSRMSVDPVYPRRLGASEGEAKVVSVVPVALINNRRPFQCGHAGCNKTFKNQQTMRMHTKTHFSDDSAFVLANSNLRTTKKAGHNKKIASGCPDCMRSFVGLYELRRHYGRRHTKGEKQFGCVKCGKRFFIDVDLRDHVKLCGKPIECKCGMKFAFKCNLVAHKKGHPECQDPLSEVEKKNPARLSRIKAKKLPELSPVLGSRLF